MDVFVHEVLGVSIVGKEPFEEVYFFVEEGVGRGDVVCSINQGLDGVDFKSGVDVTVEIGAQACKCVFPVYGG